MLLTFSGPVLRLSAVRADNDTEWVSLFEEAAVHGRLKEKAPRRRDSAGLLDVIATGSAA
jgi:hypothetical protein